MPDDILQFTLRVTDKMQASFKCYHEYPFDCPTFKYRYEIQSFTLVHQGENVVYRFDFYEQTNNSITCKEDCDCIPELDIDFLNMPFLEVVHEKKPHKF